MLRRVHEKMNNMSLLIYEVIKEREREDWIGKNSNDRGVKSLFDTKQLLVL